MTTSAACLFCSPPEPRIVRRNALAYALHDAFPVTRLHTLVVPTRHAADYFALTSDEVLACHGLLHELRHQVLRDDPTVEGFNIGLNVGEVAGQTIFHCHFHLIPRRRGDVEEPRGGVRHLIPGKGNYGR